MNLHDLLASSAAPEEKIKALSHKTTQPPRWDGAEGLRKQYDPSQHPVMDKGRYPDIVTPSGTQAVTRIAIDLQRLATKRMTELLCGTPIKRVYRPENERQQQVADFLERVYERNRIDSLNIERLNFLFAGCEVLTLWYAIEEPNHLYGRPSALKLRCRNFSPMQGEELFPLFDAYGDLQALSVAYQREGEGGKPLRYFDTYTDRLHVKWRNEGGGWQEEEREPLALGKIPAVYAWRPSPIWEQTSGLVYEMEWALSRNGNYLRDNSKPLFVVFANENISYGDEGETDREFRSVMQFPQGSSAQYITWTQAVDNLKFYVEQLRSLFFAQLQLPDWSYERMSQQALSGESRKQMFIDAHLKVKDESGRIIELLDREANVLKAFAKGILGQSYATDIDALTIEHLITPYAINEEADTIKNLITANGGEPIISQRESIELYGHSKDIDRTLQEIAQQRATDALQPEAAL